MISPVNEQICKDNKEDGPTIRRFISDSEVNSVLPAGHIVGVEYDYSNQSKIENYWVIFLGITVFQVYPSRAHNYWHRNPPFSGGEFCFLVEPSRLLDDLEDTVLLQGQKHFILEFEDDVLEIICDKLIFGESEFTYKRLIENSPDVKNKSIVGRF